MTIKTDNKAALSFLEAYNPDGPWVLMCISTDKKGIACRTFAKDEVDTMRRWLEDFNGKRNIYFHVNSVTKTLMNKANREQIRSLDYLHVDIDPRAGEDLAEEQARCLGLLTTNLPKGVPAPTCVIFSGGGYQGFWKLEKPVPIEGDLKKAEDAKLYNLKLEGLFGADQVHNIDRIMRLPGTINIPDARKKKRGRTEVLATLHSFAGHIYPIDDFDKAAEVQQTEQAMTFTKTAPDVTVGGDVKRVLDLEELDEWNVSNRVRIIIAQGETPDEPKEKDNSRSAWLHDVCCSLSRQEVPPNIIYAIITDPEWGISESVIELKGNSAHTYALRQIRRGIENAIDPALEELNSKFSVIETIGGKCRVMEEVVDPILDRPRLTLQSFQDFTNRFGNRDVKVGETVDGLPRFAKLGKWWLGHKERSQWHTITFAPGKDVSPSYNLWKGFACEATAGDCGLFLEHARHILCRDSEEHYDYLMGWLAQMIQYPARPGECAVVLQGGRGTGKSFFAVQLGRLLGRHFLHISNSSHLTGNFNAHLRDLVLLFADEAFYAGDKKHTSILKTLITETTLTIEKKGVDVENSSNCIHLIMASNEEHVVPAGELERRFFVLDVGTEHQQDTAYFKAIADQMDSGGREALLYHLQHYDLSDFNVRNVPGTRALHQQQMLSLAPEAEWWLQKLLVGQLLWGVAGWPADVPSEHLVDDFVEHTKKFGNASNRGNQTKLGMFFSKHWPGRSGTVMRVRTVESRHSDGYVTEVRKPVPCYTISPLDECRQVWEKIHGKMDWPSVVETDLPLEAPPAEENPFK
jgi:hypothetical protein